MYNLHCHSLLSDGALLPSELAVRYAAAGYRVIAITDHADYSNIKFIVTSILEFAKHWPESSPIRVLPGVELTHIPPRDFLPLTRYLRKMDIQIVVGHGETTVEPVSKGTNRAAIEAGVDILAHPGLICDSDIRLAAKKKVFLELTSRHGHCEANSYVAERAIRLGAPLIINMDAHEPKDILTPQQMNKIALAAGLSRQEIDEIYRREADFLREKGVRLL
jgi:histidinol phosphatase-like PHP family hydrolase